MLLIASSGGGVGSSLTATSLTMAPDPIADAAGASPLNLNTAAGVGGSSLKLSGALDDSSGPIKVDTESGEGGSSIT
jgi:hypothetical protein